MNGYEMSECIERAYAAAEAKTRADGKGPLLDRMARERKLSVRELFVFFHYANRMGEEAAMIRMEEYKREMRQWRRQVRRWRLSQQASSMDARMPPLSPVDNQWASCRGTGAGPV